MLSNLAMFSTCSTIEHGREGDPKCPMLDLPIQNLTIYMLYAVLKCIYNFQIRLFFVGIQPFEVYSGEF